MPGDQNERVPAGAQPRRELDHEFAAQAVVGRPVGIVKGAAGGGDRLFHVRGRGIGGVGEDLAGPGVDIFVLAAAGGLAQLAVDIELAVREF